MLFGRVLHNVKNRICDRLERIAIFFFVLWLSHAWYQTGVFSISALNILTDKCLLSLMIYELSRVSLRNIQLLYYVVFECKQRFTFANYINRKT